MQRRSLDSLILRVNSFDCWESDKLDRLTQESLFPSGLDSPNGLWDSRPLRLSTDCHFLSGIYESVISLPIVRAKMQPTLHFFVWGYFYGLTVVPAYPLKNLVLAFPFHFLFNIWKIRLRNGTVIHFNIIPKQWTAFSEGLYDDAKGRQLLSNPLKSLNDKSLGCL